MMMTQGMTTLSHYDRNTTDSTDDRLALATIDIGKKLQTVMDLFSQLYGTKLSIEDDSPSYHHDPEHDVSQTDAPVLCLPDSVTLHLFSFLEARDLCAVAAVCRRWWAVSGDQLLWQRRLATDERRWDAVSTNTHPDSVRARWPDWGSKQVYLRCSPALNRGRRQQHQAVHRLSHLLRGLINFNRRPPKIVCFGPGLESSTSGLMRKILSREASDFTTSGMFPGAYDGFGSGFNMHLRDHSQDYTQAFDLVTLYTSNKQEREGAAPAHRLHVNKLLVSGAEAADLDRIPEVRQQIKDVCRGADGFMFVVDGGAAAQLRLARPELRALVNGAWARPGAPLLVLSCVVRDDVTRTPAVAVARCLKLAEERRPWTVRDCVVEGMVKVTPAVSWLLQQTQRA